MLHHLMLIRTHQGIPLLRIPRELFHLEYISKILGPFAAIDNVHQEKMKTFQRFFSYSIELFVCEKRQVVKVAKVMEREKNHRV